MDNKIWFHCVKWQKEKKNQNQNQNNEKGNSLYFLSYRLIKQNYLK